MLILARRSDESIVINGEIVITVLDVSRSGQVRLGITAPRHVQVYRHELLEEIQAENRIACAGADADAAASLLEGGGAAMQGGLADPAIVAQTPPGRSSPGCAS